MELLFIQKKNYYSSSFTKLNKLISKPMGNLY